MIPKVQEQDATLKVAGYVRMSTDAQKESPAQQQEHIARLAHQIGFREILWYEDQAVSGNDTKRRVGFQQLISDALDHKFKTIICWSLDRFGRFDSIEAAQWAAKLRKVGVKLITVAEGPMDWNETGGRLIFLMHQEQKHTFLLDRARDITRGSHRRAGQPGFYLGTPPYGYDKLVFDEQGKLQLRVIRGQSFVKPKAWTARLALSQDKLILRLIRWIFLAYANGASLRSIALKLNLRKQPSPAGKHWRLGTVRSILENPTYTGDQVWNRRHSGKYFGIVDGHVVPDGAFNLLGPRHSIEVNNARVEWVVVPDDHPGVVDRKLFGRAQARLRPPTGKKRPPSYDPLTGLVYCGHCGGRMYIQTDRAQRYVGRRLVCRTASAKGSLICRVRSIDERLFLIFLMQLLKERVFDSQWEERMSRRLSLSHARISDRSLYDQTYSERIADATRNEHRIDIEVLAELARAKVSLTSSDFEVLRSAMRAIIVRIELWFGSHPTTRNASKITKGTMKIRSPLDDALTGSDIIEFSRDDFDRATAGHSLVAGRKRNPGGQFVQNVLAYERPCAQTAQSNK